MKIFTKFSLKSDSEFTFKMIIVFIPLHEVWYCVECQEKDLIWYHSHGSEEDRRQHTYINYYLEQKEKFAKRFLNIS